MRQVNIVGTSPPSQPSRKIQTLPAPPDMAPANVTLRTASETSLWLRWMVRRNLFLKCQFVLVMSHCKKNLLVSPISLNVNTISFPSAFAWMGI